MGGPHVSRHILVQQILAAGERRTINAKLPAGEFRLRTLEPGGEAIHSHDGGPFPTIIPTAIDTPGRQRVEEGKRVSERDELGGGRNITKKIKEHNKKQRMR